MNKSPDPQSIAEAGPKPDAGAPNAVGGSTVARKVRPKVKLRPGSLRRTTSARPAARPVPANTSHPPHTTYTAQPEEKEGYFKRNAPALIIGVLVIAAAGYFYFRKPSPAAPPVKQERLVMVSPLPPPPPKPVPPPPPQQKPPEQKMEKETAAEETKPVEKPAPAKAPDDPAPLGTGLKGDGAGLPGLGSGSGLGGGTLGNGNNGGGGSRFGWYAGQVQSKITEALRSNPKTKSASLRIEVRIWPDSTGRITRAQLAGSTGDPALDGAIQNGVLTGLQLQEPPPAGMRLPIVLRLTARRPN